MNKQQLATKIWAMANDMRSKIAANEYKDFILWFMFYKFLSDKELKFLHEQEYTVEEMKDLSRDDIIYIKEHLWYYIKFEDLFWYWIGLGIDFDISNVRDALSNFNDNFDVSIWSNINQNHKKVFENIFEPLQSWLGKLWDSAKTQTKAVSKIINLINTIPMETEADYDVLWFIYEYLIYNFAANAKKAWEFYTPHEVSKLMSEIVAHNLRDRDSIKIYDPTSWSGSLLINIWKSVAKQMKNPDSIHYYAQELKKDTYSLTRMNLVMRWISSHNIHARNADTLEEDWPLEGEWMKEPLRLDAVVSNPPYSQGRSPSGKKWDPRFIEYWLAPKGKADYAFLLHDLYHMKTDGIMTIVLPHWTLFRWWDEYEIRKNLIENNRIDAIIWLPANIFFGTPIQTIIMVLKKQKTDDKIQIIDASRYFEKAKKNKLRDCDVKRIFDAIVERKPIPKFSKIVSKDEIIANDYNLNIPRYVDSSDAPEKWDIYATMFWWIPEDELNDFNKYFELFPDIKNSFFKKINEKYYGCTTENIHEEIEKHNNILSYKEDFIKRFSPYKDFLKKELLNDINRMWNINIWNEEVILSDELFNILDPIKLIDNYDAYQILASTRKEISWNLELIQDEWIDACRKIDPNTEWKKTEDGLEEVQKWFKWHIIGFDIVKKLRFQKEVDIIESKNERVFEISNEYDIKFSELSEDDISSFWEAVNEEDWKFVNKEVENLAKEVMKDKNRDTSEDAWETKLLAVNDLVQEEKKLKREIKALEKELLEKIMYTIENLTDDEILEFLHEQRIMPIMNWVNWIFNSEIENLANWLNYLYEKYKITLSETEKNIKTIWWNLSTVINDLAWDAFDIKWLNEFKSLLD